ncbi:hypothetical protein [Nonomuraea sp. NPDC049141]|uniref:hypothetical protein n=1 Tax=unclassified Nonomuraea TaxID=2593643 RepID=UPI0033D9591D
MNPYNPVDACNSNSNGSTGYSLLSSATYAGGSVHLLHSDSARAYCAVLLKAKSVGENTDVWLELQTLAGGKVTRTKRLPGRATYLFRNFVMSTDARCVRFSGGTAEGSTSGVWGQCGS